MRIQSAVFLAVTLLLGCIKDNQSIGLTDTSIDIISPINNQELYESDTARIQVYIVSDDDIHDYQIEVINTEDSSMVYSYEGHSHSKEAKVNLYFLPGVLKYTQMKLIVQAMNHNGSIAEKSVTFSVINNIIEPQPQITILSPYKDLFADGETLNIKGVIEHTKNLKSARIWITKENNLVFNYLTTIKNTTTHNFDTIYGIRTKVHAHYLLNVSATDVIGVSSLKTYDFHVHPQ